MKRVAHPAACTLGAILLPASMVLASTTPTASGGTAETWSSQTQSSATLKPQPLNPASLVRETVSPSTETPSSTAPPPEPIDDAGSSPLSPSMPSEGMSSPASSSIPYKEDDTVDKTLSRLGWVLLLLAAIWGAVLYLQKRRSGSGAIGFDRRLKVVETLRLSARNALYLIEMDHRTLLLSMNGNELKVLAAPPDLPASQPPMLNPDEDER